MRRAIRRALPGVVIALERPTVGEALAGDHAFKRCKPMTVVGLAPLPTLPRERGRVGRGAGALRRLDLFAKHRRPLVPIEQPALMERHRQGKRLRLPRLPKYRPFGVARKARHGPHRITGGSRVNRGHGRFCLGDSSVVGMHSSHGTIDVASDPYCMTWIRSLVWGDGMWWPQSRRVS